MRPALAALVLAAVLAAAGAVLATRPAAAHTAQGDGKTPTSCLDALADARSIFQLAADEGGLTAKLLPLVSRAAIAGSNRDAAALDTITSTLRGATTQIRILTARTRVAGLKFQYDATNCRAGVS